MKVTSLIPDHRRRSEPATAFTARSLPGQPLCNLGVQLHYDLFDGGRKRARLGERRAQLSQAKEHLAKIEETSRAGSPLTYNKLERTQQMMSVSEEVGPCARVESRAAAGAAARRRR